MKRTFKAIAAEAADYGITVKEAGTRVQFIAADGKTPAWMYKMTGQWRGYTEAPSITGRKGGTKGEVAHWCLDWAANGF